MPMNIRCKLLFVYINKVHVAAYMLTSNLHEIYMKYNEIYIKAILFNTVKVIDEFDIAHLFNNFHTRVATELESNMPASNIDPLNLMSCVDASLFLYPVSANECTKVIDNL